MLSARPPPPPSQVVDLVEFLLSMKESDLADLESIEIVPPAESIAFKEKQKADRPPRAAKIVPPNHNLNY